jgi:putative two-component system response regulator
MKKFDLIVLDLDLPDMNGFEICDDLKQRHISKHTPIVFISFKPSLEDQQRGLEFGAVDYIPKPFDVEFAPRLLSHIKTKSDSVAVMA